MKQLLNYTRTPIDSVLYDPRLAYSMHLALGEDDKSFQGLNHNSGVLFVKATENGDGSLNPMSIKNPYIFQKNDGTFGVLAIRILADGEDDESSKGKVVLWSTDDFLCYREEGLITLVEDYVEEISCVCAENNYQIKWSTRGGKSYEAQVEALTGGLVMEDKQEIQIPVREKVEGLTMQDMEGAIPQNILTISDELADYLSKKLMTVENVAVTVPADIAVKNETELQQYCALAYYSDGSWLERKVNWDTSEVDWNQEGVYEVQGEVEQKHFPFPVAFNRADPCITKWKDKYYFIATNDADDNHTLFIREADSLTGLVDAEEHLILDSSTYEGIGGLLWAPEFHEIHGKLYIFHAATPGEFFWEESCLMELREGGNPTCAADWSRPKRIVKMDGSDLCEAGKTISLDMTCFPWGSEWYVIWSQREFLPKDLGAWLYIAKLNDKEPWKLASEPVILSKPDYGWGNNHTFVEEGPYALVSGEKLYITFSAAAVDTSYVVSYLVIEPGKDLLVPENWRKNNYPIFTSRSVDGEFGTGHNAYYTDEDGMVWNTYHARPGTEGVRSSGIRRVHFDVDGAPMLDMTEEKDLKPELRKVVTLLRVFK